MRSKIVGWFLTAAVLSLASNIALISLSSSAHAHAVLLNSIPNNGESTGTFPDSLQLFFSEPILDIQGPKGSRSTQIQLEGEKSGSIETKIRISGGKVLITPIISNQWIKTGKFLLNYRVVSQDGHIIKGEINFIISKNIILDNPILDSENVETIGDVGNGTTSFIILLIIISSLAVIALLATANKEVDSTTNCENHG